MTTTIDPLGTPEIIYNRAGVAIVEMDAQFSPVNVIPQVCGHMVIVATAVSSQPKLELPSNAEIGSVVEIHLTEGGSASIVSILPPSGETITGPTALEVPQSVGRQYRKVRSDLWAAS